MKRNTVLKLLTVCVMTSVVQLSLANSGLSAKPLSTAQRIDTIRDTIGDSMPPVLNNDRTDTHRNNTVNERESDLYDRNNGWKNKESRNDRKSGNRNNDDRNHDNRNRDEQNGSRDNNPM